MFFVKPKFYGGARDAALNATSFAAKRASEFAVALPCLIRNFRSLGMARSREGRSKAGRHTSNATNKRLGVKRNISKNDRVPRTSAMTAQGAPVKLDQANNMNYSQ